MALYNANLIIRETRKAQGLTQEQLAEGICSRETIVKLEKGERKPNWFVFKEILTRLGLNLELYQTDVLSESESKLLQQANECLVLLTARDFAGAAAQIAKIDAVKDSKDGEMWQSGLGYSMWLRIKANYYSHGMLDVAKSDFSIAHEHLNPQLAIKYSLECLELSRPNFDIDKIDEYFLAIHEYKLLMILARSYIRTEESDKAMKLFNNIKASMEKGHELTTCLANIAHIGNPLYHLLLADMSTSTVMLGRYEEALKMAEEGATVALNGSDYGMYFVFISVQASCLKRLGRIEESLEFTKKSILSHYIFDGFRNFDFKKAKEFYEAGTGGQQLNLTVPW